MFNKPIYNKPICDSDEICPFRNKVLKKVCHKCPLYIELKGMNANTGEETSHWGCSFAFMPMLTVENTQKVIQAGAAIESARNESVVQNNEIINILRG